MAVLAALALLLGAGIIYQLAGARAAAKRHPPPGALIDVDGQQLHVVCGGTGRPTVVFESGIAASSLSWSRIVPAVATWTRTCAYDRAGLGWSGPVRARRTPARMLRELDGVVAHADASAPAVLVGHSFGAFLVAAY